MDPKVEPRRPATIPMTSLPSSAGPVAQGEVAPEDVAKALLATEGDNGKVLVLVGGVPTWVRIWEV